MRLQIEATEYLTTLDGVPVRVWNGITEDNTQVFVFVHRIAVRSTDDQTIFEKELETRLPPGSVIPLRMIL